jgi:hypothetical protein
MWELGVNLFERYYGSYSEELRPFVETMLRFSSKDPAALHHLHGRPTSRGGSGGEDHLAGHGAIDQAGHDG